MDYIGDAAELARRVRRLAFGGGVPEALADKLQVVPGSDADLLTEAAELLYAFRDQLEPPALEVMGQLFLYAKEQRWTTFNRDGRSDAIVSLVRRDLGEKGGGVAAKAAEWPEPEVRRRDGFDWRKPEGDQVDAPAAAPKAP